MKVKLIQNRKIYDIDCGTEFLVQWKISYIVHYKSPHFNSGFFKMKKYTLYNYTKKARLNIEIWSDGENVKIEEKEFKLTKTCVYCGKKFKNIPVDIDPSENQDNLDFCCSEHCDFYYWNKKRATDLIEKAREISEGLRKQNNFYLGGKF